MVISREDRILINVLHQEKGYGSIEVLSWISKQSVWTDASSIHCVGNLRFSVLVLKDKKISQHRKRSSLKFYSVPKW